MAIPEQRSPFQTYPCLSVVRNWIALHAVSFSYRIRFKLNSHFGQSSRFLALLGSHHRFARATSNEQLFVWLRVWTSQVRHPPSFTIREESGLREVRTKNFVVGQERVRTRHSQGNRPLGKVLMVAQPRPSARFMPLQQLGSSSGSSR